MKYLQFPFPPFLCSLFFIFCSINSNAQWKFSGSPEIGTPIRFDVEGDTFFVSSLAGLFYSDDGVNSWHPIPLPSHTLSPKEVYAENDNIYIVAAGTNLNNTSIYRSNDFGTSWTEISPSFATYHYYYSMLVQEDTLVIFLEDSLAISYNNGDSYSYFQNSYFSDVFLHEQTFMSLKASDLYASSDHGITWELVYDTPDNSLVYAVTSINGLLWKTAILFEVSLIDVSYSTDSGYTWTSAATFDYDSMNIHSPIVGGEGGELFISDPVSNDIMYHSSDGGLSWELKNIPENSYDPFFANDIILLHHYSGINISVDGGNTFQSANKGFTAARISNIVDSGDKIWTNANLRMFEKENDPFSWKRIPNIFGAVNTQDGHLLALVDSLPKVSSNGGASWTTISNWAFGWPFYPSITKFESAGNIMFVISPSESWYSVDHGDTWHSINYRFDLIEYNGLYIASVWHGDMLFSENGFQWQDINYDLPFSGLGEADVVYHHNGYIFTSIDAVLYRLPVFGDSWEIIPNPASNVIPNSLSPNIYTLNSYNQTLIAGVTGYGVFLSDDNGNSWQPANEGLEDFYIRTSTVIDDTLYIGADGGIWKRALNELIITNVSSPANNISFSVSPNPVQDYLTISVNEDIKDPLTLIIYDATGVIVESQIIENMIGILDIHHLAPGVYYISARQSKKTGVVKVIKY